MIDRVVDIAVDAPLIRVEATVPGTSTISEGHFPGYPLMPGVLLIETMAQASGFLILARIGFERMPLLAAVREAKLRRFVGPGERLEIEASLLHEGSGFSVARSEVRIEGKQACEAELTFRIMPFPDPGIRRELETAADRVGLRLGAPIDGR